MKKGKEDANRVSERYGIPTHARPEGPLIWLHAVGLGEVMAAAVDPVTLSRCAFWLHQAHANLPMFSQNLPERTLHQYLPLDVSGYCKAFLAHWSQICAFGQSRSMAKHDLACRSVWHPPSCHQRGMNTATFQSRHRAEGMFADIYGRFALISAQDEQTAAHIRALGATVQVDCSLKPLAPALRDDQAKFETLKAQIGERPVLCLASSHPADEDLALSTLGELSPETLLIIVPRRVERSAEIADIFETAGFSLSVGDGPIQETTRAFGGSGGAIGSGTNYVPMPLSGVGLTKPKGIIHGRP